MGPRAKAGEAHCGGGCVDCNDNVGGVWGVGVVLCEAVARGRRRFEWTLRATAVLQYRHEIVDSVALCRCGAVILLVHISFALKIVAGYDSPRLKVVKLLRLSYDATTALSYTSAFDRMWPVAWPIFLVILPNRFGTLR